MSRMAAKARSMCGCGGIETTSRKPATTVIQSPLVIMEGKMTETTETLALLRNSLAILSSIAERADLPALIGLAELEATQTAAKAKRKTFKKR